MPNPLNTRTAAVVDPILSTVARGYRNQELVSHLIFPRVSIPNRSMRVLAFGKEGFRKRNTRRAPGADKMRVQYGYASDPVSLVQDALEGIVPIEHMEEAASVPGINLASNAIGLVMDVIDLGLEIECAEIVLNAANYSVNNKVTLTGSDRWADPTSDPLGDINEGKEAIRRFTGRYPNTLSLGPDAATALKKHPAIKDQFKYTSKESITNDMLAAYFEVDRVVVGKAVYLPENAADDAEMTDVWGNDALLSFVPLKGDNYAVPSFGYTYELNGYPQVNQPYFENKNDSWIYPAKVERRPYLVGPDAGFLLKGAGGAV